MAQFRTAFEIQQFAAEDTAGQQAVSSEGLVADALNDREANRISQSDALSGENFVDFAPGGDNLSGENFVDFAPSDTSQTEKEGGGAPITTKENPLDEYPNYTYGISLHYLDLTKYNSIVTDGGDSYNATGGEVLIASGGRRGENFSRNQYFEGDMYFENLKMNTIIGYNSRTRASNVVDINFTVIEPYSITFLNKIIRIARDNDIRAWDQMPFLLQIDFFANTEDGPRGSPIDELSKRIVIKVIDIKIKLTSKGAEYAFVAIPQSHVALTQSVATVPINIEVVCKKVKDFFDAGASSGNVGVPERVEEDIEGIGVSQTVDKERSVSKAYSLPAALKAYQEQLVKKGHQKQADEYVFVVDEVFADADIIAKKLNQPYANLPPTNEENPDANLDFNKTITRINAGTSIPEVINQTMFASSYYTDLIKKKGSGPVLTHRIRTTITYDPDAWDSIRKEYKKTVTFYIEKYEYHNQKFPQISKSLPESVHKQFFYMYTGKNDQILDLTIDFNAMFYVAITAFENKAERRAPHRPVDPREAKKKDDIEPGNDYSVNPNRVKPIIGYNDVQSSKNNSKESVEAVDFQKSLMSSSRGDMLNVKMKVSGDPDLIKQDDTYYGPGGGSGNSIPMDIGQLFAGLYFRTPDDINLDTGLYDFDESGENVFNGKYQVIAIENTFERGQFTQMLDMIRLYDQDGNQSSGSNNSEREEVIVEPTQDYNLGSRDGSDLGSFNEAAPQGEDSSVEDFSIQRSNTEQALRNIGLSVEGRPVENSDFEL
jgi:hypothetical protein